MRSQIATSSERSFSLEMVERLLKGMPGTPRIGFSVVDGLMSPCCRTVDVVLRCQQVTETANVSVRMNRETATRIRARAEARGERLSDALRRYAEEGDRAESHPGIVFRSGPAGRRAGLAGGPDVWEICFAVRQLGGGREAAERLAEDLSLTPDRIAVALRYEAEFPDEIAARIELHVSETAHYEALAD